MELGEIVVAERPSETQLYAEQMPRTQDLLGRSRNQIHQVVGYLTGEMKEYGEWMKSKQSDMSGAFWLGRARWEHLYCQQHFQCWGTRQGRTAAAWSELTANFWPFNLHHLILRKGISLHPVAITMAAGIIQHRQKTSFTLHQLCVISIPFLIAVPRITRQGWGFSFVCKCFGSATVSLSVCGLMRGT